MTKNISFYGYNDGKAMTIYTCIMLYIPTVISVVVSIVLTIFAICFSNYDLLFVWICPLILGISYLLSFATTNYNDKVFLRDIKKKHTFVLGNGVLYKDNREIKNKDMKLYKFKKCLFLNLNNSYYRIPNEAFIGITRQEFLFGIKFMPLSHKIEFIERYKCPCCGFYTLSTPQLYDICPVCFWEDSPEIENPDDYDECNGLSLNEARKNYLSFGSCKKDMLKHVRKPMEYEKMERYQKFTFAKFEKMFIEKYASEVSGDNLHKYVLGEGNYIWHLFSWEFISPEEYLTGEAAKKAYDQIDKTTAIVLAGTTERTVMKINEDYISSKNIEGCGEIYVFAEDMSWVYINTHEESVGLGPYFIEKQMF